MIIHVFDRSDLDEVVALAPGKPRKQITRREDLAERGMCRSDVVMMNMTNSGREYCLYVTADGFVGDLWLLDVVSKEQHAQIMVFAEKMRRNAIEYPPARKLLS